MLLPAGDMFSLRHGKGARLRFVSCTPSDTGTEEDWGGLVPHIGRYRRGGAHRVAVRGWTESPHTPGDEESEKARWWLLARVKIVTLVL